MEKGFHIINIFETIKVFTFFHKDENFIKKFFLTKVYSFTTNSIFFPSIKILFSEVSPWEYKSFDTSANVFFEHYAKCREIKRAKVE